MRKRLITAMWRRMGANGDRRVWRLAISYRGAAHRFQRCPEQPKAALVACPRLQIGRRVDHRPLWSALAAERGFPWVSDCGLETPPRIFVETDLRRKPAATSPEIY